MKQTRSFLSYDLRSGIEYIADLYFLTLAASKTRHLKRGVKEVVKSVRKGEKGLVFSFGRGPPPF